jgi:hypothetical protein
MRFVKKFKPKHVKIDLNNLEPQAVCDRSGFIFLHKDLVKQKEWAGNNLVWTGLLVGKPYVDIPNPQARPPKIKKDPIPVKDPRLPEGYIPPESNPIAPPNVLKAKLDNYNWGN